MRDKKKFYLARYTKKVWLDSYGKEAEADWYNYNCPDNIYNYLEFMIDMLEGGGVEIGNNDEFHIFTLNDEYLKYLKDNGIENTADVRAKYPASVDYNEKQLFKMAKDEGMMCAYTLLTIPVIMHREETSYKSTSYKLDESQIERLTTYLEKIHGKGNVFVYGNFLGLDNIQEDCEKIVANGKLFFEKGIRFDLSDYRKQRYGRMSNMAYLGIPFLVKTPVKKIIYTYAEIDQMLNDINYMPDNISALEQEDFVKYGINTINFEDTSVHEELEESGDLSVIPAQVSIYDLADFIAYCAATFS